MERNGKYFCFLLFSLLQIMPCYSQTQLASGYESIEWGASPESVRTKYSNIVIEAGQQDADFKNSVMYYAKNNSDSIISGRGFVFYKNRLVKVICEYNPQNIQDFNEFLNKFFEKFGIFDDKSQQEKEFGNSKANITDLIWTDSNRTRIILRATVYQDEERLFAMYMSLDETTKYLDENKKEMEF